MTPLRPLFFSNPFRYCRWVAREYPNYFASIAIGLLGPVLLVTVPPIRRYFGDETPARLPQTYPIPNGPRKHLTGYDDDTEDKI